MAESRRVLAIRDGRGARGGTTLARWLIGNARQRGRQVRVYDFDRNHRALALWEPEAVRPRSAETDDVQDALTAAVNEIAASGIGGVIDMGGGDRVGRAHAQAVDLVRVCDAEGVGLLVYVPLGPDEQDVDGAVDLAESGVYLPEQIVLVPNLGLGDGDVSAARRFALLLDDSRVRALCEQGMEIAEMPKLLYASTVEKTRVGFWDALAGKAKDPADILGPSQRGGLKVWLHGIMPRGRAVMGRPGMDQTFGGLEAAGRLP